MEWRLNKRALKSGMEWRLNKRAPRSGMEWRLNKKASRSGMEWRLNKRSDEQLNELEDIESILYALIQSQNQMKIIESIDLDSEFWQDQDRFPMMFQQLFRINHAHSLIMNEMVIFKRSSYFSI